MDVGHGILSLRTETTLYACAVTQTCFFKLYFIEIYKKQRGLQNKKLKKKNITKNKITRKKENRRTTEGFEPPTSHTNVYLTTLTNTAGSDQVHSKTL